MATADIIALFSDVEGMPNSIIEGMALGKPILMTKVSDFKLLVDEQNGIIVEDSSIASIKKALITASQLSAVQLERMGNASKTKAVQLFESEKILQQWMQLF
jgi:glycosyltransferase involved in cell wall biosynthesis